MLRLLSLVLFLNSFPIAVSLAYELGNPLLYCGHFGSRNRVGDRLECAVGPNQHSLEPYPFDRSNFYVEDETGQKIDGLVTRDGYTVAFVAKQLFVAKRKYKLQINLSSLNRGQKRTLRLTWDRHLNGTRSFCFEGMETIEDTGTYSNRPERGNCAPKKN